MTHYQNLQLQFRTNFSYNPLTGELRRYLKHTDKVGFTVGENQNGTYSTVFFKRYYPTAHFIWIYQNGTEPPKKTTFLDGDCTNLKLSNIHFPVKKIQKTIDTTEKTL